MLRPLSLFSEPLARPRSQHVGWSEGCVMLSPQESASDRVAEHGCTDKAGVHDPINDEKFPKQEQLIIPAASPLFAPAGCSRQCVRAVC